VPGKLTQEDVEIIFWKSKRKDDPSLVYETFLKAVIAIARIIFPELPPMEAFVKFSEECFTIDSQAV